MEYGVYVLMDVVAGLTGETVLARTDEAAVRNFVKVKKHMEEKGDHPEDIKIFRVGLYDNETMVLKGIRPVDLEYMCSTDDAIEVDKELEAMKNGKTV